MIRLEALKPWKDKSALYMLSLIVMSVVALREHAHHIVKDRDVHLLTGPAVYIIFWLKLTRRLLGLGSWQGS